MSVKRRHAGGQKESTEDHPVGSAADKQEKKQKIVDFVAQDIQDKTTRSMCDEKIAKKLNEGRNKIVRLASHPRNAKIKTDGKKGTLNFKFMVNFGPKSRDYTYKGLTKVLKRVFYPRTEDDPRKKSKSEKARSKSNKFYKNVNKMKRTCESYGKDHGTLVHSEIECFTDCMLNGKSFRSECPDPDPCTLRIICILNRKGWYPILGEHMIWDEDLRVATAIDMICIDSTTGDTVMIELKTGYEGESYNAVPKDPKLPRPIDDISNCPRNRHMLQLMTMDMILRKKYHIAIDKFYIIRTLSKQRQTEKIPMNAWCKKKYYRENVYTMISEYNH